MDRYGIDLAAASVYRQMAKQSHCPTHEPCLRTWLFIPGPKIHNTFENAQLNENAALSTGVEALNIPKAMQEIGPAPYRVNLRLTVMALAAMSIQFVLTPLVFLPQAPELATAAVLLLSLATPIVRALLHEAIHGRLAQRRVWNDLLGRALAIYSGIAFDAIRFGHLAHHRFSRHALDRADVIEPNKNRVLACVIYYGGLIGWIHYREILASALLLLPRPAVEYLTDRALPKDESITILRAVIGRGLDRRLRRARIDLLCIGSIYTYVFYLYGHYWPILLLAISARAFIISVQDNVAHYGTPAMIGAPAHNSNASRWFSFFILNQNLHGVHHDRPELPWNKLPEAVELTGNGYVESYLILMLRQFRGPRRSFILNGAFTNPSEVVGGG